MSSEETSDGADAAGADGPAHENARQAVVKVDDTEPGIAEGVAAGGLAVGVLLSGNHVGRTPEELAALPTAEVDALREHAAGRLRAAGAEHLIDTVADLPTLLERLDG